MQPNVIAGDFDVIQGINSCRVAHPRHVDSSLPWAVLGYSAECSPAPHAQWPPSGAFPASAHGTVSQIASIPPRAADGRTIDVPQLKT